MEGTDVCMDVHCECGHSGHAHGEFGYFYRCVGCRKLWSVGQNVRLHALTHEESAAVESDGTTVLESEL